MSRSTSLPAPGGGVDQSNARGRSGSVERHARGLTERRSQTMLMTRDHHPVDRNPETACIERWAPIGGIVFVVFMVVGSRLVGDVPPPDAPEREIVNYLTDGSTHIRNIIGAYLW